MIVDWSTAPAVPVGSHIGNAHDDHGPPLEELIRADRLPFDIRQREDIAMLKVMATLIAKADKIDETKAALSSLVEPTQAEAGCISYSLFQSDADPTEFVTIEEWTDQAAIDAHMGSKHIGAALAAAPDILAADPKITNYTKIA